MFNKFCFDGFVTNEEGSQPKITIRSCYAFEFNDSFTEMFSEATQIINDTSSIKSNDIIFFSPDIIEYFSPYKLENYCAERGLIIRTTADFGQASVLICSPFKALEPVSCSLQKRFVIIPIQDVREYISNKNQLETDFVISELDGDLGYHVDWEQDYFIIPYDNFSTQLSNIVVPFQILNLNLLWALNKKSFTITNNKIAFSAYTHFIEHEKRIISHLTLINALHEDSAIIDEEMADNLLAMISSPDPETVKIGLTIISDCNRKESLPFIAAIYNLNKAVFDGANTPSIKEFIKYIDEMIGDKKWSKNAVAQIFHDNYKDDEAKRLIHKYKCLLQSKF
jgi:hypothetical protein